jgi:GPH family glycoside/pentoside/hexuronide:cation symporter
MAALGRGTKVGYGVADFGIAGAELLLQLYLLEFYIRAAGLSPTLAGAALALAILWDAVTDPVMGSIVDHTRSRYGRFHPYLAVGAVIFAIGLVALFHPPALAGQTALFLYLLGCYLVVNTGMTLLGVPHIALGGALSKDTHERTELYGWRLVFGTVGLFAGILAPLAAVAALQLDVTRTADLARSRGTGSLLMAAAILASASLTIVLTLKRARSMPADRTASLSALRLLKGFAAVFANRTFIPFYLAFLLVAMARAMNATLALPYYKDSLRLPESSIQGPILGTFTLCIVLSVPLWVAAGRRFGKKLPATAGMALLGAMTMLAYPLFPVGGLAGPVIAAIVGGIAVGAIILVESMVPDIADEDKLNSGEEREGLYFGFWRLGQKLARSITLGLTGVLLSWIGYEEAVAQQSEETARRLAWAFGLGPGGLFLAASLVFLLVPLSRQRQLEIQRRMNQ